MSQETNRSKYEHDRTTLIWFAGATGSFEVLSKVESYGTAAQHLLDPLDMELVFTRLSKQYRVPWRYRKPSMSAMAGVDGVFGRLLNRG